MAQLVRSRPLAEQIRSILLTDLSHLDPELPLPSEVEIARRFGVSRATVRDALRALEHDNIIIRRQGVGTFLNPHALAIRNPIDEALEFGELIRSAGFQDRVKVIHVAVQPADEALVLDLRLEAGAPVVVIEKLFLADTRPVIYCVNILDRDRFPDDCEFSELDWSFNTEPIYDFVEACWGERVEYHLAELSALNADSYVAEKLQLPQAAAIFYIKEIAYNAGHYPLFLSHEYYNSSFVNFQLIRRRLKREFDGVVEPHLTAPND